MLEYAGFLPEVKDKRIAVVCGWIAWPMTRSQLTGNQHWPAWLLQGLRVVMTIVAPVVILTVMLKGLGLF